MSRSKRKPVRDAEIDPGKVEVTRMIDSPPEKVWEALTDPEKVDGWFGALSSPLVVGQSTRLDFGDGDFFTLNTRLIQPPYRLQYEWRFLGIGPLDTITWETTPKNKSSLVKVTDTEPERTHEAARLLRQGWIDFTNRLVKYLRKGKPSRYQWRREFDACIELGRGRDDVWDTLFQPGGQARWLPQGASLLKEGADLKIEDGLEPSVFRLREIQFIRPSQVRFEITHEDWLSPTQCCLLLTPRRQDFLLSVSHNGWEAISSEEDYQKRERTRFSLIWISALQRARQLLTRHPAAQ